jgi:small neutral amino acid transporter SnatA (MarC family)
MNVVTRVMGLILAAIAVELMAGGAAQLLRAS